MTLVHQQVYSEARNALEMKTRKPKSKRLLSPASGNHAQLEPVDDLLQQCARGVEQRRWSVAAATVASAVSTIKGSVARPQGRA